MYIKTIIRRYEILQKEIGNIKKELAALPDGKLICSHNKKYTNWYISDGHHKTYLPKSKRSLAEKLALKKYLTLKLQDLTQEKSAFDLLFKHHNPCKSKTEQFFTDYPEMQELLTSYFQVNNPSSAAWMQADYEKNSKYPEYLIHKTSSGIYVRSKSEAMIVHSLFSQKIPFRYECALEIGSVTLYPDFTILHPQTQELYYWEHFGKMDDEKYAKNTASKLQLYISHQIIPSINLITTYETAEHPFTYHEAQNIIENYFL